MTSVSNLHRILYAGGDDVIAIAIDKRGITFYLQLAARATPFP